MNNILRYLNGYKIIVTNHALRRFLTRTGEMTDPQFKNMIRKERKGCKITSKTLDKKRVELSKKFKRSRLVKIKPNGEELRREITNADDALNFWVIKKGHSFILKTTFLQGKKNAFWKTKVS